MARRMRGMARAIASPLFGLFTILTLASCTEPTDPDSGDAPFALVATYDSIRSYPGGGGVFLIQLGPEDGFSGQVLLTVEAADRLRAEADVDTLSVEQPIAEVLIRPEEGISTGHFQVKVTGSQGGQKVKIPLDVEIVDWQVEGLSEWAVLERDRFTAWLAEQDPAFGELVSQEWLTFQTYPEMLVVEHWTFLSQEWEMRICVHVMVPPDDWSMVRLRRRGEASPAVTAKRETDGTIHSIPVGDYPIFGY